jgi:flagellar protein FliS
MNDELRQQPLFVITMNKERGNFMSPQTLAALDMYEGVAGAAIKQIDQNDQHKMVQVLIEGAIKRVREANAALGLGDFQKKSTQVTKAQKIIFGLRKTLDHEKGGEVAMNLDSLYDYCLRSLTLAHSKNDSKKFLEVGRILEEVLSGWKEIRK